MCYIAEVQDPFDEDHWITKEFNKERDAYEWAYRFPRWEVYHS